MKESCPKSVRAFVVAMASEAAAVRPHLKASDRLLVCGVGKVNAAAATQKAIDAGATEVWNVGVAGGLDPAMEIGASLVIDRAVEYDFDLATVNGTRIGVHNERTTPYFSCAADFAPGLPRATLATGDRFNDDAADFATIAGLEATVRDMEGAAIAHVCETNGVPCRTVKCLSDVRGHGTMTGQYKDNLAKALAALSRTMQEILR